VRLSASGKQMAQTLTKQTYREAIHDAFNLPTNRYFTIVNDVLAALTLLSIACIVLETVPSLDRYHPLMLSIEGIALVCFTIEYLARIYSAPKRRAYIFSFFGLIDLLAILPSFLHIANLTFLKSARVLRILRLLRMIRLAKIAHLYHKTGTAEGHHIITLLNVQIYFLTLFSAIILLGSTIYVIEAPHTGFVSIPEGMIWAADVILGGGIPDNDPRTVGGKLVTLLTKFVGLALLGILIAVIGSFMKQILFGGDLEKPVAPAKATVKATPKARPRRRS
jgi:voltage-gated potassium channel